MAKKTSGKILYVARPIHNEGTGDEYEQTHGKAVIKGYAVSLEKFLDDITSQATPDVTYNVYQVNGPVGPHARLFLTQFAVTYSGSSR